ncbi:MAG: calcium-binding protein, partial [Pseudomonadota bacterium]
MGRNIDSKNEYFSGIAEYDRVTRTYNKNFDFFASAGNIDETLILKEIHLRSVTGIKANPNFYYYGDGGTDTLEYMGDDLKKVVMTAHSSYDFYLTGGYDRNPGGGWDPDSLDVFTDDVERFVLTQNNDDVFINGASFSIYLDTREGNDEVESTRYADEIWAGSGNDTIESGGGGDTIYGEAGNDRIYADADRDADDVFNGGDDNDSIYGYGGNDVLDGGEGADTIYGGDGEDIIHSGGLKDETGANHLYGGGGADLFIIGNGKNDYTDSFTFDFSEAFSNGEGSWTDIMDSAGTVMGAAPQLKALGSGVKGLAAGFDLFYEATSNGTSNVSFELTKDWNSVTEVQVKDFNPFEDNIMIPIDLDGSNLINYAVTWDEHSTHAFTVEDQRDGSNFQILTVQWADNLADYVPDYMTSGGDGEILIGTYYNALQNSLARSHLVYDGDAMYLGGDHLEDGLAEDANTGLGDEDMGFMSIGAYGGWEIYADNDSGSTFMGTTFDDTLGGFIPLDVEEYSPALAADAKAKTLFGMAGDDLLFGGAGNDTINGGEELDGSSGSDTVAYFEADFVIVDLRTVDTSHLGIDYAVSNAQYTTYGGDVKNDADVLYDIENVIGSDGNDTITGDGAQNYLYGQGGN